MSSMRRYESEKRPKIQFQCLLSTRGNSFVVRKRVKFSERAREICFRGRSNDKRKFRFDTIAMSDNKNCRPRAFGEFIKPTYNYDCDDAQVICSSISEKPIYLPFHWPRLSFDEHIPEAKHLTWWIQTLNCGPSHFTSNFYASNRLRIDKDW